jgi:hypothetical protein
MPDYDRLARDFAVKYGLTRRIGYSEADHLSRALAEYLTSVLPDGFTPGDPEPPSRPDPSRPEEMGWHRRTALPAANTSLMGTVQRGAQDGPPGPVAISLVVRMSDGRVMAVHDTHAGAAEDARSRNSPERYLYGVEDALVQRD